MRLAWLTDLHLNFLGSDEAQAFCAELAEADADAFLITGDVGEAHDVIGYLNALDTHLQRPLYFVLGNHDFYRGSIERVREKASAIAGYCPLVRWLPAAGVVPLTKGTCLVGHDGWADGRNGDYWGSTVELNDWHLIEDLAGLNRADRLVQLQRLGDYAAAHFRTVLPSALDQYRHVIVATHVPPFPEACVWQGRPTDDDWLPHMSCKAVGDALREAMAARPDRMMTVLCGHTHQAAEAQILPNMRVITGGAEYGAPDIQAVLTLE